MKAYKANKIDNITSITNTRAFHTFQTYHTKFLQPLEDNNYCTIINLHFYQPFEAKLNVRGLSEQINLINDCGYDSKLPDSDNGHAGYDSSNISVFNDFNVRYNEFPFKNDHTLNLNGMSLTVILFPSTMAYLKEELPILRKYLSRETLAFPFDQITSYFGEDPSTIQELALQMNFQVNLTRSSDLNAFGFKVSIEL